MSRYHMADQKWPWPREVNHRWLKHPASFSHLSGQTKQPAAKQQHHFTARHWTGGSQWHTLTLTLTKIQTATNIYTCALVNGYMISANNTTQIATTYQHGAVAFQNNKLSDLLFAQYHVRLHLFWILAW